MKTNLLKPILLIMVLMLPLGVQAKDIDRGKSLGFAQAIGGPNGLAFGIGLGDFHFESILGGSYFPGGSNASATFISAAFATHYHLLRAQHASLSLGTRVNLGTGSSVTSSTTEGGLRTEVLTSDIVQWGIDIPLRVYWFPAESISVHTEFGIAILMGADGDQLFGQTSRNGFALQPGEVVVRFFEGENAFGRLGLTFWW